MNRYSPSKLKSFKTCKLKYKLFYIDKIRIPQPISVDIQFGNMMHKIAEIYNGKDKDALIEIVNQYKSTLSAKYKTFILPTIKNFFKFYTKYNKYKFKTEKSYELKTDEYWLYGIIDRLMDIIDGKIVVDYKTSAIPNRERHIFQMKLYNLIISKSLKINYDKIKCMIYYPRPHEENKYIFSTKEMVFFEKEIIHLISTIENNDNWEYTKGYHCKWCEYKGDKCPVK